MKKSIYVPDIECDSCSRLITKKLGTKEGIKSIKIHEDAVEVDIDETKIKDAEIVSAIRDLGFRASTEPFDRKTIRERLRDYKENSSKYAIEKKIISYTAGMLILLLALQAAAYFTFLNTIPGFLVKYWQWILYLDITVAVIITGVWHVTAYRTKVTCMVGMMIGMTLGMQTGMMLGAVLGATNGFFIGALAGMILGVAVGATTGNCCGIMGIMEGMMAGVMGGTMGAMISVMMFSDHLEIFMPIYMIINIAITWGLSYMTYEELVENKKGVVKKPKDFTTLAAYAIIASFILLAIMIYGPKSGLVSF